MWNRHNGLNQQWDIVYVDQWKADPKKGELNKDFGMYVQRDFYIQTQLKSKRYLDLIGRNLVLKTKNGRRTQRWYFHQQTLSIRSRSNNQSWDIKSAGKTSHMQVWSSSGKWW
jgi:membrane carboxypeptidase/penicillin-binding protein PbpC